MTTRTWCASRVVVGDQFEQAAVGVAEVDAGSLAAGAPAPYGAKLDLDVVGAQVVDRGLDLAQAKEAEIAAARAYGKPRNRVWLEARSVDVELLLAEAVHRNRIRVADELRAEDIAVEAV